MIYLNILIKMYWQDILTAPKTNVETCAAWPAVLYLVQAERWHLFSYLDQVLAAHSIYTVFTSLCQTTPLFRQHLRHGTGGFAILQMRHKIYILVSMNSKADFNRYDSKSPERVDNKTCWTVSMSYASWLALHSVVCLRVALCILIPLVQLWCVVVCKGKAWNLGAKRFRSNFQVTEQLLCCQGRHRGFHSLITGQFCWQRRTLFYSAHS